MTQLAPASLFAALALIQCAGLLCAVLARVAVKTRMEFVCHWLFYASLLLVGTTAIAAFSCGMGCGLVCGTTLAVMAVTAILDFGPVKQGSAGLTSGTGGR